MAELHIALAPAGQAWLDQPLQPPARPLPASCLLPACLHSSLPCLHALKGQRQPKWPKNVIFVCFFVLFFINSNLHRADVFGHALNASRRLFWAIKIYFVCENEINIRSQILFQSKQMQKVLIRIPKLLSEPAWARRGPYITANWNQNTIFNQKKKCIIKVTTLQRESAVASRHKSPSHDWWGQSCHYRLKPAILTVALQSLLGSLEQNGSGNVSVGPVQEHYKGVSRTNTGTLPRGQ